MSSVSSLSSCSDVSADASQVSLEKLTIAQREVLVRLVVETTMPEEKAQFYGWVLSGGSHIQQRQCEALARYGARSIEAARQWLKGASECPGGILYGFARCRFDSEEQMASAFGEFIGRDLIAEARR